MRLLVEGWRWIPHSFALVGQHLAAEWARTPGVEVRFRDVPYLQPAWRPAPGPLLHPDREATLRGLRPPADGERFDAVVRFFVPYDFRPDPRAGRAVVWGATEAGVVQTEMLERMGVPSLAAAPGFDRAVVLTCSRWSADGFARSGAAAGRVRVVPLGFDPAVFRPLPAADRAVLRKTWGWDDDRVVFLNVGMMTRNKGLGPLLTAFAAVAGRHPNAWLVLKGADTIADSRRFFARELAAVPEVAGRIRYFGNPVADGVMAALYQAADVYVSPYRTEGFNLPVLEAAACGTLVVCTAGGPTDEFTRPEFALPVRSRLVAYQEHGQERHRLEPDADALIARMEEALTRPDLRESARTAGPAFLTPRYTWPQVAADTLAAISLH